MHSDSNLARDRVRDRRATNKRFSTEATYRLHRVISAVQGVMVIRWPRETVCGRHISCKCISAYSAQIPAVKRCIFPWVLGVRAHWRRTARGTAPAGVGQMPQPLGSRERNCQRMREELICENL